MHAGRFSGSRSYFHANRTLLPPTQAFCRFLGQTNDRSETDETEAATQSYAGKLSLMSHMLLHSVSSLPLSVTESPANSRRCECKMKYSLSISRACNDFFSQISGAFKTVVGVISKSHASSDAATVLQGLSRGTMCVFIITLNLNFSPLQ